MAPSKPTACLALSDGTLFPGHGFGATGQSTGAPAFSTAMSGYQEALTDPASAGHLIVFTFPHIGNTGTTPEDDESGAATAAGLVLGCAPGAPSNWRNHQPLDAWAKEKGLIGIHGVDTRRLARAIRDRDVTGAALIHDPAGNIDTTAALAAASALAGVDAASGAPGIARDWTQPLWTWPEGYEQAGAAQHRVVVIDLGAKRNSLRALVSAGCAVQVVPASATIEEVLALKPDGVFLSGGPGDPAVVAETALPLIRALLAQEGLALFGTGLGHQLLALALGAQVLRLPHGHHGTNHPVMDLATGKVAITSMNHGFAVDARSLPAGVVETHRSLFDGTNCGIRVEGRAVWSLQHGPEASPGPHDSLHHFTRFAAAMATGALA